MAAEQLAPREGLAHIAMGVVVQRDPHQIKQDRHQVRPLGFGSLAAAAVTLVYARRLRLQRVGQRSITIGLELMRRLIPQGGHGHLEERQQTRVVADVLDQPLQQVRLNTLGEAKLSIDLLERAADRAGQLVWVHRAQLDALSFEHVEQRGHLENHLQVVRTQGDDDVCRVPVETRQVAQQTENGRSLGRVGLRHQLFELVQDEDVYLPRWAGLPKFLERFFQRGERVLARPCHRPAHMAPALLVRAFQRGHETGLDERRLTASARAGDEQQHLLRTGRGQLVDGLFYLLLTAAVQIPRFVGVAGQAEVRVGQAADVVTLLLGDLNQVAAGDVTNREAADVRPRPNAQAAGLRLHASTPGWLAQAGHSLNQSRHGPGQRQCRGQVLAQPLQVAPGRLELLNQPVGIALLTRGLGFAQLVVGVIAQPGVCLGERRHLGPQILDLGEQPLAFVDCRVRADREIATNHVAADTDGLNTCALLHIDTGAFKVPLHHVPPGCGPTYVYWHRHTSLPTHYWQQAW